MPWNGIFANLDAKCAVWVTTEPRSAAPITRERRCSFSLSQPTAPSPISSPSPKGERVPVRADEGVTAGLPSGSRHSGLELAPQALEPIHHRAGAHENALPQRHGPELRHVLRRDVRRTLHRRRAGADHAEVTTRPNRRLLRRAGPQHRILTRARRAGQLHCDDARGVGDDHVLRRQAWELRRHRWHVHRVLTQQAQLAVDPDEQLQTR